MGDELEPRRSEKLAKALREESLAYGECLEREDGWRIRADAAEARVEALTKALEEITGPRDANSSYLGLFHEDQRIAAAALAGSTVESAQQPAWRPFVHGETALEFGQRYAFADPATRRFSIQWAHAPEPGATWCISLGDLLASIPTPPKAEAEL